MTVAAIKSLENSSPPWYSSTNTKKRRTPPVSTLRIIHINNYDSHNTIFTQQNIIMKRIYPHKYFQLDTYIDPLLVWLVENKGKSGTPSYDRHVKHIFEYLKQHNCLPYLGNNKLVMEVANAISYAEFQPGAPIDCSHHACYILVEGELVHAGGLEELAVVNPLTSIKGKKVERGEVFGLEGGCFYPHTHIKTFQISENDCKEISFLIAEQEEKKLIAFLEQIPILQKMYKPSLFSIMNLLESIPYSYGQTIFEENSHVDYVYIVACGQFMECKHIQPPKMNTDKCRKHQTQKDKVLSIRLIEKGEMIGVCELLHHGGKHMTSLRCQKDKSFMYRFRITEFLPFLEEEGSTSPVYQRIFQQYEYKKKEINRMIKMKKESSLLLKHPQRITFKKKLLFDDEFQRTQSLTFFNSLNRSINKANTTARYSVQKPKHQTSTSLHSEKTPAVVQQVIQIMDQKKKYFNLRSLKKYKTAFEFNINDVPKYIKKKYAHILDRKQVKTPKKL